MRYLGNKSKILPYIEDVIEKYQIEETLVIRNTVKKL